MLIKSLTACVLVASVTGVMTAAAGQHPGLIDLFKIPSVQSVVSETATIGLQGWTDPRVVAGDQADLDPQAMVIGLRCGDHSRAYFVPAWDRGDGGEGFLIRDMLGDQQITIALSGRDDQVVVWRQVGGGKPQPHPYRLVSWYTWLQEHPQTDLAGSTELPSAPRHG